MRTPPTRRIASLSVPIADPGALPAGIRWRTYVEKVATPEYLIVQLKSELAKLESLGALVAAAHLDACIATLSRDFRFRRQGSDPD